MGLLYPKFDMQAGIYIITNSFSNKKYVGSTNNLDRRWAGHQLAMADGTHHNKEMLADYLEFGLSAFSFAVYEKLTEASKAVLHAQETKCMKALIANSYDLYNVKWPGDGWSYIDPAKKQETTIKANASRASSRAVRKAAGIDSPYTYRGHDTNSFAKLSEQDLLAAKDKISKKLKGIKRGPMSDKHKAKIAEARKSKTRPGA